MGPRRHRAWSCGPSTSPLDIAQDMPHLRPFTVVGALALAITSVSAMDLGGYSVVKLHGGLNSLPLAFAGHLMSVVIGHRENFNAHSFDVVTF